MSGNETVFGGGTNPKQEDETYLSLLKNSVRPKIKIKVKKNEEKLISVDRKS